MLTTEIIILPLFAIFFNVNIIDHLPFLLLVLVLGTIGFSSVGTLFAAIATHTRMREVMLPVLLLPVTVPVLIGAVETTAYALGAQEWTSFGLVLLIGCDMIYFTVCLLVFEFVIQE
jgi:heme exporter protein B